MATEFDLCWSTVIAASDTYEAFVHAPENGWVQRCRLGLGHDGTHGSDAGAEPPEARRTWVLWLDGQSGQRLAELDSCVASDGVQGGNCVLFADHGGPHRFAPPSTMRGFGAPYRPEVKVSRNGSRNGTLVTVSDEASREMTPEAPPRRHREPEPEHVPTESPRGPASSAVSPADDQEKSSRAAGHSRTPTVDEALLAVADALTDLARALRHRPAEPKE
ncbi:hypothetical protein KXR83_19025 [Williamsia muralis]|uniref:hypothetical protein n=1 Tax=Williamsia marianensis TaxID=85044 RepID=UPI003F18B50D